MTANNYFRTGRTGDKGRKGRKVVVVCFDDHSKQDTAVAFEAIRVAGKGRVIAWRPPRCSGPWDFGVGYVGRGPVKSPEEMETDE